MCLNRFVCLSKIKWPVKNDCTEQSHPVSETSFQNDVNSREILYKIGPINWLHVLRAITELEMCLMQKNGDYFFWYCPFCFHLFSLPPPPPFFFFANQILQKCHAALHCEWWKVGHHLPEPVPESSSGGESSLMEGFGLGAVTGGLGLAGGVGRRLGVGAAGNMQHKQQSAGAAHNMQHKQHSWDSSQHATQATQPAVQIHACFGLHPLGLFWAQPLSLSRSLSLMCMCVCVHACVCMCRCVCRMCVCVHVDVHVCMCVSVCIHAHTLPQ